MNPLTVTDMSTFAGGQPLSDAQSELLGRMREFCTERVLPRANAIDIENDTHMDLLQAAYEAGITAQTYAVPKEFGGLGEGLLTHTMMIEEAGRASGAFSVSVCSLSIGATVLKFCGGEHSPHLQQRYFPKIREGALTGWAGTEAHAGTDMAAWKTRAEANGDYRISGSKWYIGFGSLADFMVLSAKIGPVDGREKRRTSLLWLERGEWKPGRPMDPTGFRGFDRTELFFDETAVPADRLVGEEGKGFKYAMRFADWYRPAISGTSLGVAQAAFEYGLAYAKRRHVFGRPVAALEIPQAQIADMATDLEVGRSILYRAARYVDDHGLGAEPNEGTRLGAIARLFVTEAAQRVAITAQRLLGGHGYTRDHPMDRFVRDTLPYFAGLGTNTTHRLQIAELYGAPRSF